MFIGKTQQEIEDNIFIFEKLEEVYPTIYLLY